MKWLIRAASAGVVTASLFLSAQKACAELEVGTSITIQTTAEFIEPLAPYGTWIEFGGYGRCWSPSHVAVEWRPYCDGHWVWTDCGWFWESNEPWAWACYHYGSWFDEPRYGWVWVPAIEWAPAWVDWRFGGGYCGWAPRHPRGIIASPHFVFIESRRLHEPIRPATVILNNPTIVQRTALIGGPVRETRSVGVDGRPQRVVVNRGPDVNIIQRESGVRLAPVPIREETRKAVPPATLRREDSPERRFAPFSPERDVTRKAPERAVPTQPHVDRPVREPVAPSQPMPTPAPNRSRQPRPIVPGQVEPAPAPRPNPPAPAPPREQPQREAERPPPVPPGPGQPIPPQAAPIGPRPGSGQVAPPPRDDVPRRQPSPAPGER